MDISPDGHYIAYALYETDRPEIYIRRYPEGTAIYYAQGNDIMVVEVRSEGDLLHLGNPQKLFTREPIAAQSMAVGLRRDAG